MPLLNFFCSPSHLLHFRPTSFLKSIGTDAVCRERQQIPAKGSNALAESYRATRNNPPIIQEILQVIEQRIRKGRTLSS